MKKSILTLFEFLIPLVLAVLLFLAKKQVVPSAVYVAAAVMAGFYFFQLRLFVGGFLKEPTFQKKAVRGFASLVLARVFAFLAVLLFATSGHPLYPITMIAGVINAILLIGFAVRNDDARLSLSHFGFMLLLGVVVFG